MSTATQRASNLFVGSPIERLEDLRFLTGRGQYVDDLHSERMLHAAILRSSVAHGRIRAIDAAAALARPGVHAVITAADIGKVPTIPLRHDPTPKIRRFEQPVIANGKVRYVGEPLAVVIADTPALAEDALEAIAVDIETMPAVADRGKARKEDVILFETVGTNLPDTITAVRGDADAAFANAPYTRREHFSVQRHAAVPMEPRGLLAEWDDAQGRITVKGVCKVPFTNRRALGGDDGAAGKIGADGRIRRRWRLRRARRVLSGGLSDSVCGAALAPSDQVDRGPARKSDVAQSCARHGMRPGDRLRP